MMNDASNAETYLKWVQVYIHVLDEKNLRAPLDTATGVCKKLLEDFKSSPRFLRRKSRRTRQREKLNLPPPR